MLGSGSIAVHGVLPPRPQCRGQVRIARDPTLPHDLGPLSGWFQQDRLPCSTARIAMCTRLHALVSPLSQQVETALTADRLMLLAGVKCSSPRFPTSQAPPPRSPSTRAASSPDCQLARRNFAPPLRPADAPSVPHAARERARMQMRLRCAWLTRCFLGARSQTQGARGRPAPAALACVAARRWIRRRAAAVSMFGTACCCWSPVSCIDSRMHIVESDLSNIHYSVRRYQGSCIDNDARAADARSSASASAASPDPASPWSPGRRVVGSCIVLVSWNSFSSFRIFTKGPGLYHDCFTFHHTARQRVNHTRTHNPTGSTERQASRIRPLFAACDGFERRPHTVWGGSKAPIDRLETPAG